MYPSFRYHNPVSSQDISAVLFQTDSIIRNFGPRLAGSEAAKNAGIRLQSMLAEHCDATRMESFSFARLGMLAFMPILAGCFLLGFLLFSLGNFWMIPSFAVLAFGSSFALEQFVMYHHTYDFLFPKYKGHNICGILEPEKSIKQTVILSAHHDSAFEFNYFKHPRLQKLYGPRIAIGLCMYHLMELGLLTLLVLSLVPNSNIIASTTMTICRIVGFLGIPLVGQFFFFISHRGTPGAGDNLVASVGLTKLAEKFHIQRVENQGLQHTRLLFISFDGEESGIRGSDAFVRAHLLELKNTPTYVINLESLYSLKHLSLLSKDINQNQPLDKTLTKIVQNVAKDMGYSLSINPIEWGGGGTDAGSFAKMGIAATTVLGMENRTIRDGLVYHTLRDTVDQIDPIGMQVSLNLVANTVYFLDANT